ncbi:MAG: hypothetical protein Q9195_002664 [Heterodermia aff. obscurata]
MEALGETPWDVVLSGTGLSQSLLALALSRSGKKVLHVDKNEYYGGTEAALSLQEIEAWVEKVNDATRPSSFRNAILQKEEQDSDHGSDLGFSRAYSISLSPQLIYTRSNLLPALVSAKVHAQLEFLAVGSWWIYSKANDSRDLKGSHTPNAPAGKLRRIPGGREDVFSDKSIDLRSSRLLMKFLKLAADPQNHPAILEVWGSKSFPEYLLSEFKIPKSLHAPLLALTSSLRPAEQTLTSLALPRIHQHLTSIGLFGPGFGAVLPKWGGLSEIAQVGCRAGAVGGGVYVLNKGVEDIKLKPTATEQETSNEMNTPKPPLKLRLEGSEEVEAYFIVGSDEDLPQHESKPAGPETVQISQSIAIISSPLSSLFYLAAEGAPPPAATVVVFPTGSLGLDDILPIEKVPPVYLTVHSSDTGECPAGQSIIYGHTSLPQPQASTLLSLATQTLLNSISPSPDPRPSILWTLLYTRFHHIPISQNNPTPPTNEEPTSPTRNSNPQIIPLPSPPPGLTLDDSVLKSVREAWAKINGGDDGTFLLFEERADLGEADDELEKEAEDQGEGA